MKRIFILLIVVLTFFGGVRLYYNLTDDFRESNIRHPMPYHAEWNFSSTPSQNSDLAQIVKQKFYYLGKGAQVYAFGSEDGQYVLKFFKFKHIRPSFLISLLPSTGFLGEIKLKNQQRKIRKLEGVFQGHAIAFEHDRENAGLIYMHLNPTNSLNLHVELIDKIGIARKIDLDQTVFVLQKQGQTLRDVFTDLLDKQNIDLASQRALQVLDMYVDEYKKGVWDRDHGITHNIGFIKDQPFHLDVGKISYAASPQLASFYESDLRHVARKMKLWVHENYPQYEIPFNLAVDEHVLKLLNESPF